MSESLMAVNNEAAVIENSMEGLRALPAILNNHRVRVSKAESVARNIIAALKEAGGEMNADLDQRASTFLANCAAAIKQMQEARKPATQIMDEIKKMFITEEGRLDPAKAPLIAEIQQLRNNYARKVAEDQEKAKREAERKAMIAKMEADAEYYIKSEIGRLLTAYLADRKLQVNKAFAAITLENFQEKSEKLAGMITGFPVNKLGEIIRYDRAFPNISEERFEQIRIKVHGEYDFEGFYEHYDANLRVLKQGLLDRLPGLKAELEQQAKAGAEEKARIEAERKRRADEAEAKIREEEAAKLEEDRVKQEAAAEAAKAEALFNQASEVADLSESPEARKGWTITVLHPAGWVEIFQLWFQMEGVTLNPEEIGSKKMDSMKKFCEDLAKKQNMKIDSKHLKYETAIKAINRKAK